MLLGCMLVMLDVGRHIILDSNLLARSEVLAMYGDDGQLTPVGRACRFFTILGMMLIGFSVAWLVGIPDKIYAKIQ